MSLSIFTAIILPFILLSLVKSRVLLFSFGFFSIFSSSAIINIETISFGLQAYHLLGLLIILNVLIFKSRSIPPLINDNIHSSIFFILFIFTAIISSIINGSSFSFYIHLLHIIFGFLLSLCLATINQSLDSRRIFEKSIVTGAIFSVFIGFLQIISHYLGSNLIFDLFNNSIGKSAGGYSSTLVNTGILRVSSVTTEPSVWIRSLIPLLAVVLYLKFRNKIKKLFITITLSIGVIISTSSIGIVSLPLAFLYRLKLIRAFFILFFTSLFLTMLLITTKDYALPILNELIFNKITEGSGGMRLATLHLAFESFLDSPFFGNGPGSITSHDLILKIISNYGIIGFVFYSLFLFSLINKNKNHNLKFAFSIFIFIELMTGVTYQYAHFWILISLLMTYKAKKTSSY